MFLSRPRFLFFTFLAATLLLTSCGGGGGGSATTNYGNGGGGGANTPPQFHVWVGKDGAMAFNPATIRVAPGATVTWDFYGLHTVTSTGGGASYDSGNLSTGTFTHTFPTEGTFDYVCQVHGAMMSGKVTVAIGGTGY